MIDNRGVTVRTERKRDVGNNVCRGMTKSLDLDYIGIKKGVWPASLDTFIYEFNKKEIMKNKKRRKLFYCIIKILVLFIPSYCITSNVVFKTETNITFYIGNTIVNQVK